MKPPSLRSYRAASPVEAIAGRSRKQPAELADPWLSPLLPATAPRDPRPLRPSCRGPDAPRARRRARSPSLPPRQPEAREPPMSSEGSLRERLSGRARRRRAADRAATGARAGPRRPRPTRCPRRPAGPSAPAPAGLAPWPPAAPRAPAPAARPRRRATAPEAPSPRPSEATAREPARTAPARAPDFGRLSTQPGERRADARPGRLQRRASTERADRHRARAHARAGPPSGLVPAVRADARAADPARRAPLPAEGLLDRARRRRRIGQDDVLRRRCWAPTAPTARCRRASPRSIARSRRRRCELILSPQMLEPPARRRSPRAPRAALRQRATGWS